MQGNNFTSAIRIIGSALVIAAVLMAATFTAMFQFLKGSVPLAYSAAVSVVNPSLAAVAGLHILVPVIVVLGYLGVSLWLATILHEVVDQVLAGIKEAGAQLYRLGAGLRRT
ncbi:hypothetical protein A9R05_42545 (plasmid) [Burkholderia sp. KK1]|uniref:Transmembrane protein n=1 Tax=Burkholderia sp. M701 TaxID=326454 RepID=V5YNI7_9BURK|nr:hypothetical protein [Burkholderia sp. M701]AQH05701.1 hypothetical protein A9R05_42545 [Burkholderia sp. KK1]BAO18942.1 hypothetical protein [Burkholderia sp. M701]